MHRESPPLVPRLRTERLTLAPIEERLARAVLAGRTASLPCAPGWPAEETYGVLAVTVERGGDAPPGWLVVRTLDRSIIGECAWHDWPDAHGQVEIGYGLAEPVWGLGYGTEAVGAVVDWSRRQADVRTLTARVLPGNEASLRLLRRLGFAEVEPHRFRLDTSD